MISNADSKNVEIIFLSNRDINEIALSMKEVISTVEEVFKELAFGRAENPPKIGVHPRPDAFIHAMPGYLKSLKSSGLKWVSGFPANRKEHPSLLTIMGLIVLNDTDSGRPLAVMDCSWITATRTGAAAGVAAKYLSKRDSKVACIIGTGIQGRTNLLALHEVRPSLEVVKVYDIFPDALNLYIAEMTQKTGLSIEAASSPENALTEADIIITATGRLDEPIYKEKWVKPGALVLPIHHRGWENKTLHEVDKFITDDWEQLQTAHKEWGGWYGPLPSLTAELGEVVSGKKPGRENDIERIIDFNLGLAIEDVVVATKVYNQALQMGIGQKLLLTDGEMLFK